MVFFRKVKGFFFEIKQKSLKDIKLEPGQIVACLNDDGTPYGMCGCVGPAQIESSMTTLQNKRRIKNG